MKMKLLVAFLTVLASTYPHALTAEGGMYCLGYLNVIQERSHSKKSFAAAMKKAASESFLLALGVALPHLLYRT
jgi:hypothetical protein